MKHRAKFFTSKTAAETLLYKDAPHLCLQKNNIRVKEKTKCIFYNSAINTCTLLHKKCSGKTFKYCLNYKKENE